MIAPVLALREFESVRCGDRFDPSSATVTPRQRNWLERFNETYRQRHKAKIFAYGPQQSLVSQNYVGVINLDGPQIELLPKIEGASQSEVRHNLAEMIAVALDVRVIQGGEAAMRHPSDTVLEILIRLFCAELWRAIHQGMVRKYEQRKDDLRFMRGRIDIARQVRRHVGRPDLLACEFEEFSEDNAFNHVLKAALVILDRIAARPDTQRDVTELLFCFGSVRDVAPESLQWHAAAVDRLSSRYKPLLELSKLFIRSRSPDLVSGGGAGFALLFDMNNLFEEYVGRTVQRLLAGSDISVLLQGPKLPLAQREGFGNAFQLQPDIVGLRGEDAEWIIDTKWKRLDPSQHRDGLAPADVYQMFVYGERYGASRVVLLYPHHSELGEWCPVRDSYKLLAGQSIARIDVATIDLSILTRVPTQLRLILES